MAECLENGCPSPILGYEGTLVGKTLSVFFGFINPKQKAKQTAGENVGGNHSRPCPFFSP